MMHAIPKELMHSHLAAWLWVWLKVQNVYRKVKCQTAPRCCHGEHTCKVTIWYRQFLKSYCTHNAIWKLKIGISDAGTPQRDRDLFRCLDPSSKITTRCMQFHRCYLVHKTHDLELGWKFQKVKGQSMLTSSSSQIFMWRTSLDIAGNSSGVITFTRSDLRGYHNHKVWPQELSQSQGLTSGGITITRFDLMSFHIHKVWPQGLSQSQGLTSGVITFTRSDLRGYHIHKVWPQELSHSQGLTSGVITITRSDLGLIQRVNKTAGPSSNLKVQKVKGHCWTHPRI